MDVTAELGQVPVKVRTKIRVEGGCWQWLGGVKDTGYGQIFDGKTQRAHRWVYEHLVGPIPEGHHLHHTCRNRACVNPAHLEAISPEAHREAHGTVEACSVEGCPDQHFCRGWCVRHYWRWKRRGTTDDRKIAAPTIPSPGSTVERCASGFGSSARPDPEANS